MGQLVTLEDIKDKAQWYFEDAYYSSGHGKYVNSWPNGSFPYFAAIHSEDLSGRNDIRISIRKWVENNLSETVIVDVIDKSYRRYTDEENSWDKSYEVQNRWVVFYFEEETTATMFRLKFSEYVKPITSEHPRWL